MKNKTTNERLNKILSLFFSANIDHFVEFRRLFRSVCEVIRNSLEQKIAWFLWRNSMLELYSAP